MRDWKPGQGQRHGLGDADKRPQTKEEGKRRKEK
jgi:hypothetical protein